MTTPRSVITVLGPGRYRTEALALSISAHTEQDILALTNPESEIFSESSTVLIEVGVHVESAIQLVRDTKVRRPGVAVVVLGLAESEDVIARLAEAGASGYVSANASFEEMLSIVHTARKGEFACTPDVTYVLFSRLAELARSETMRDLQTPTLTIRERQVLALLTQGLSNKKIGDSLGISAITVKNHVHHLLTKIGARDRRVAARLESAPASHSAERLAPRNWRTESRKS
jgi:two-component system nitrate/nitrite response regulator NarL